VQTMKGAGEVGEGEIFLRKMGGKEAWRMKWWWISLLSG
jgi:hypothetical protein